MRLHIIIVYIGGCEMIVLLFVCMLYMMFYGISICYAYGKKGSMCIAQAKRLYVLFVLSVSFLAYCFDPPSTGWDLTVHYQYIDLVRATVTDWHTFFSYMFDPTNAIGGYGYAFLYTFKIVCLIIAKIGNDRILPFISVFMVYHIWGNITFDWIRSNKKGELVFLPAIMFFVSILPFVNVSSGIRNALAASIAALAIYNNIYKGKSVIVCLILFGVAVTIHYAVIVVIPFWLISKLKIKSVFYVFLSLGVFLSRYIAQIARNIPVAWIKLLANTYLGYLKDDAYFYSYGYLIIDIVFLVCIIGLLYKVLDSNYSDEFKNLARFIVSYSLFVIGHLGCYDLILRPCYVLAVLSTPITYCFVVNTKNRYMPKKGFAVLLLSFAFFLVALYVHGPAYLIGLLR